MGPWARLVGIQLGCFYLYWADDIHPDWRGLAGAGITLKAKSGL